MVPGDAYGAPEPSVNNYAGSSTMKDASTLVYTNANKASWDASAHLHGQGSSWDELLEAGNQPNFNVLDNCLTATLTDIGVV